MIALALLLAAADPSAAAAPARAVNAPPDTTHGAEAPPPLPTPSSTAQATAPAPTLSTPLMARFSGRITTAASSTWTGWPSSRLVDGDASTSWFSAGGDAAALGTKPWIELRFPDAVTVTRVTLLGNREPAWLKGFSIHYGMLEVLDDKGAVLASLKNEAKNTLADIAFAPKAPIAGARAVRFTSLMDDGDRTHWRDIALAEVLVE